MSDISKSTALADRIIGHYERHARDWDASRRAPNGMTNPGTTVSYPRCRKERRFSTWVVEQVHPWRWISLSVACT